MSSCPLWALDSQVPLPGEPHSVFSNISQFPLKPALLTVLLLGSKDFFLTLAHPDPTLSEQLGLHSRA